MGRNTVVRGRATGKRGRDGASDGTAGKDGVGWGIIRVYLESSRPSQTKVIWPSVGHVSEYRCLYEGATKEVRVGRRTNGGHTFRDLQCPKRLQ